MSERTPTDVLMEQARESATILRADLSGPHLADLLTALADRLDELKDAAAERDRAHATLREIADGDDIWPEDLQRLARERLEADGANSKRTPSDAKGLELGG